MLHGLVFKTVKDLEKITSDTKFGYIWGRDGIHDNPDFAAIRDELNKRGIPWGAYAEFVTDWEIVGGPVREAQEFWKLLQGNPGDLRPAIFIPKITEAKSLFEQHMKEYRAVFSASFPTVIYTNLSTCDQLLPVNPILCQPGIEKPKTLNWAIHEYEWGLLQFDGTTEQLVQWAKGSPPPTHSYNPDAPEPEPGDDQLPNVPEGEWEITIPATTIRFRKVG